MNKQKKRAISRGKFERVRDMAVSPQLTYARKYNGSYKVISFISTPAWIYWCERHLGQYKYFRKSIIESLS